MAHGRDLAVGQRLGERFVVVEEVARGGMGVVYRTRDERDGDEAALKVLGKTSGSALARFEREARVLARLAHPNVVHYRAHGRDDDRPWLAMDWLEGVSLAEALDEGRIGMPDVGALSLAVCRGLQVTHARGIVHRDLKPSNIFLPHADPARAILLDFGVAQAIDGPRLTDTGATLGTPVYMAPEQAQGSRDVDHRADLYALGAVLFECLTGRPPFVGSTSFAVLAKRLLEDAPPLASVVGVPEALARVVDQLLQRDPAARPTDAKQVAAMLGTVSFADVGLVPKLRGPPVGATATEQRIGSVLLAGSAGDETITASDARVDQDALRRLASSHGATVQLAASDAVMLTFTRSATAIDSASAAAWCALALRSTYAERAVAIATGDLVLGQVTISGDAVDRAAGLLDPSLGIGVDTTTAELLAARFELERAGERWRLVGERRAPVWLPGATTLTGRRRELRRLLRAYEDVAEDERPAVVVVTGEAGMGKSRLATECVERLRERTAEVRIVLATGRPAHRDVPFGVASQLVRTTFDEEGAAEATGSFLSSWSSTSGPASRDPALLQRQLSAAFERWLRAVTAPGPVVLLLEDMHWADRPSVELLDTTLAAVQGRPLLLVALGRPELHERFGEGWRSHDRLDLRLAPLDAASSRSLLVEVGIEDSRAEDIIALADGNPFALIEMGRAERRGAKRVPATVLAAAQTRLDDLSPGARRAARAASVFGRTFDAARVAAVLATPENRVRPWLEELVMATVIEPADESFLFAHDLLVEATYATWVAEDRRRAHAAAARFLDGRPDVEPDELSRHYRDGGDLRRAAMWSMRAAERALALGDLERALALSAPVPEADDETKGRLALVAAEAHIWRGRHDRAFDAGQGALALLPTTSRHGFRAVRLLFEASRAGGEVEVLTTLLDTCIAATPEPAAATDGWLALAQGAQFATRVGDYDRAERAVRRLAELGPPELFGGHLDFVRAMLHLHRGEVAEWRETLERALAAFTEAGDLRNACAVRGEIGFAASEQGAYDDAEAMLVPALGQARTLGLDHVTAWLLLLLGPVLARVRGLEAGIETAREAIEALERQRDPRLEGAAHAYLGALLLEAGDVKGAAEHARRAMTHLGPFPPLEPLALGLGARVAVAEGDAVRAFTLVDRARHTIDELGGVEEGEAQVDLGRVEALVAMGRTPEAQEAALDGLARLEARALTLPETARAGFMAIATHAALARYAMSKRLSNR